MTSGRVRKRGASAGVSARKPSARRSRIFHRSPVTADESALSASGAVIFQPAPSFSSVTAAAPVRELDLRELVVGVGDDGLVAQHRHRLRERRPHRLRGQEHARLAVALDVDPLLLRHRAPHEQGPGRAVLVAAEPHRDAGRLVEPVGGERLRRVVRELDRLGAFELLEEVGHHLRVGAERARLHDAPLARLVGDEADLIAGHVEVEAGEIAPVEGHHAAVAEIGHRARGVARDALRHRDHRGLVALARVDPDPGRVLAAHPEDERRGGALDVEAHFRLRRREPEVGRLGRVGIDLAVHARGGEAGHHVVHRGPVGAHPQRLEHLPAVRGALQADGLALARDGDALDVLGLDGPDAPLGGLRLLALGIEPVGVVVEEAAEAGGEQQEDDEGLAARHGASARGAAA